MAYTGLFLFFIDYDYDYYGYGDYRGGYSDPYYDDYYRYEDYYYDYAPPPPPARGRGRQAQPVGRVPLLSYVCTFDCGTVFSFLSFLFSFENKDKCDGFLKILSLLIKVLNISTAYC